MIKRIVTAGALLLLLGGAIFFLRSDLNRIYLPTATSLTAKQVCSLHFVRGSGQVGYIFPAEQLVIVRLGATHTPGDPGGGGFQLAADIAAALLPEPDTGDAGGPRAREASPETYPPAERSEQIR